MRIAIIGAGFCGLALSYFLLRFGKSDLTLFDSKGIGGGASGIAAGLLHPYPGEQGRRSWRASEAIETTAALLREVEMTTGKKIASFEGIISLPQNEEQMLTWINHSQRFKDVELIEGNAFLITSGITVNCQAYLRNLWGMVAERGGCLIKRSINSFSDLEGYDHIVLAGGNGIAHFPESEKLRFRQTKGQVLKAEALTPFQDERSTVSKGYLAKGEAPGICYLGATYERLFTSVEPDRAIAEREILPKIARFFPDVDQLRIISCSSGVRVARIGHYYPIIAHFPPSKWVFTGMGSRGLLYHAYLAQALAEAIYTGNAAKIPSEVYTQTV
jgi:glycine/D-amino acid oxidase-like deaminating enzyme